MLRKLRAYTALVLLVCLWACVPATPIKQAHKVAEGLAVAVKSAMNAAGSLYRAGLITDAQWDGDETHEGIGPLYEKYRAAGITFAKAEAAYVLTKDPSEVAKARDAQQAAGNALLELIDTFSRKKEVGP